MSTIIDGLKEAAIALRAADKIPEYNTILDAQQRIFDLQNENQELKKIIEAFEEKGKMVFAEGKKYLIEENGDVNRHFCPVCWDNKKVRSPLISGGHCCVCKGSY